MVLLCAGCSVKAAVTPVAGSAPTQNTTAAAHPAAPAGNSDVALRVLVLDDGGSWAEALRNQLKTEGVPFTRVDLTAGPGHNVTSTLLASQDAGGAHGHFSAIIAPRAGSALLTATEQQLLSTYQSTFNVRLIETAPTTDLALDVPQSTVYRGPIDGAKTTVTSQGEAGAFSYLRGAVQIDPGNDDTEAALVRNPGPVKGVQTTPFLTMLFPGTKTPATLIRAEVRNGRERMIVSFNSNAGDESVKLLAHGMIRWVTRDVSVSHFRSYFSVHADDLFLPNSQWSVEGKCEIGRNCPPTIPTTGPDATIRMVPADLDALVAWQKANGVKIDLALNGAGAAEYAQTHGGRDPLADRLVQVTADLRLLNHTYTHAFLGCQQVLLPNDWHCVEVNGAIQWVPADTLAREIVTNQEFMRKMKLDNFSTTELVTGEHSGLRKPPQQPDDNPALADVLTRAGILWTASDDSDENGSRRIGSANTVPRTPIDLDYDTPTMRQVVSLYNWKNDSLADGGSGECAAPDSQTECVAPVDLDTGFNDVILPMEADKIFTHMISDDPRPHFVHQSNLTSQRLLYPILDQALSRRADVYSDSVPLINPSMSDAGQAVVDRQAWDTDQGLVDATVSGSRVTLINHADHPVRVPVSLPDGADTVSAEMATGLFGEAYAGQRSAWVELAPGAQAEFETAGSSGFPSSAEWR